MQKDKADRCNHGFKSGSGGSHRTGGLFTFFCQHGICYAFFILPFAEGRDEAYSFLVSYFKIAPRVIIYDFACSLQEYCLNRAPAFFKNTLFLVDRFHWCNHKACAPSYNLSLYAHLDFVNSEVAEQVNSVLSRLKSRLSQMGQLAFMLTMRLVLNVVNDKKHAAIRKADAHVSGLGSGRI